MENVEKISASPATPADIKRLQAALEAAIKAQGGRLDQAVERIVSDQEAHAARLLSHDEELKKLEAELEQLREVVGVDKRPWYKAPGVIAAGVAGGVSAAVVGGAAAIAARANRARKAEMGALRAEVSALGVEVANRDLNLDID